MDRKVTVNLGICTINVNYNNGKQNIKWNVLKGHISITLKCFFFKCRFLCRKDGRQVWSYKQGRPSVTLPVEGEGRTVIPVEGPPNEALLIR